MRPCEDTVGFLKPEWVLEWPVARLDFEPDQCDRAVGSRGYSRVRLFRNGGVLKVWKRGVASVLRARRIDFAHRLRTLAVFGRRFCLALLVVLCLGALILGQNAPFDVGVKVGQKIPPFKLSDQNGTLRDFTSVKGSKGLVLLFFRSADW